MSARLMHQVWDLTLPGCQKLVMLALACVAHDAGHCRLTLSRLAALVRVSQRTLRQRLAHLEAAGMLSYTGEGETLLYRLHLDRRQDTTATWGEGER
jgi:MarR-like DNA-binding transcriptional regulator SgrR of sgrS sRNA